MPGLVGFAGEWKVAEADLLLRQMGQTLEPEERFQRDFYTADGVGLGRVSLGLLNPQAQPVWDPDKQCALMLEGEVLDYAAHKQTLVQKGYAFRTHNDAEFVLAMYLEYGEAFVERLNGAFAIAIWDTRTQKLVLVNDRWSLFPLYYTQTAVGLLFGSGVRALLADPHVSREVDQLSLGQLISFDHVLGEGTLLTAVKLLRPAHILTWREGVLAVRPYWQLRHPEHYPLKRETEWMDELAHYWAQAVRRQNYDQLSPGILLSGGLDSRMVLAELGQMRSDGSLHALTWGIPGCDDARFAHQLSRKAAAHYHFYELKPDWLLHKAAEGIHLTDGMANLVNLHAMANLEAQTDHVQVIYKGFMGDAMLGFPLRYQHWAHYTREDSYEAHHQVHADQGVMTFDGDEYKQLFTVASLAQMPCTPDESYRAALDAYQPRFMSEQRVHYSMTQRTPRMALNGVLVVRGRTAVRLPFVDNDLVDFAVTVPPGLLYQRRLVRQTFIRDYPELAKVPATDTGLPMMDCFQDVRLRAENFVRGQLNRRGMKWVQYPNKRKYQNYNLWFRTALRDWTEGILLDKRTLERGYFQPDYIHNLVTNHMNGTVDKAGQLGALLSIELWHRQMIDGEGYTK